MQVLCFGVRRRGEAERVTSRLFMCGSTSTPLSEKTTSVRNRCFAISPQSSFPRGVVKLWKLRHHFTCSLLNGCIFSSSFVLLFRFSAQHREREKGKRPTACGCVEGAYASKNTANCRAAADELIFKKHAPTSTHPHTYTFTHIHKFADAHATHQCRSTTPCFFFSSSTL